MSEERLAPRAGTIPAKNNRKRQLNRADVIRQLAMGERDFSDCVLAGADLSRLDLSGADFTGADLRRAKFNMANLTGANLRRANLFQANFAFTALDGVEFAGSSWPGARFLECTASGTLLERLAQEESSQAVAERTVSGMKYRRP